MNCYKVIVDCDAGIDDALALIALIAAHKVNKIKIIGITCVTGNAHVDDVVINVYRILQVCDIKNEIAVFKGAESPLLFTENTEKALKCYFHGTDGMGDIFKDKPDISTLQSEHAVCALNRIVSENKGEISLVCLGPLTNVALALRIFPGLVDNIKNIFAMGGCLSGIGNITPDAEFNFFADPESVHIVLHCGIKEIYLLPWETCLKCTVTQEWRRNVLGIINNEIVQFLNKIDSTWKGTDVEFYKRCDAILAAVILRPDSAINISVHNLDIQLNGNVSKLVGKVIVNSLTNSQPNAHVIQDLNWDIFKDILLFAVDPVKDKNILL